LSCRSDIQTAVSTQGTAIRSPTANDATSADSARHHAWHCNG